VAGCVRRAPLNVRTLPLDNASYHPTVYIRRQLAAARLVLHVSELAAIHGKKRPAVHVRWMETNGFHVAMNCLSLRFRYSRNFRIVMLASW
jgi:hypothetical protein